jgi:hypothetical protein
MMSFGSNLSRSNVIVGHNPRVAYSAVLIVTIHDLISFETVSRENLRS